MLSRRNLITTGVTFAAGLPLASIAFSQPVPVGPKGAKTKLLHQSVSQVYADLKANKPNAARMIALSGQLSVLFADLDDDGTLAKMQAIWHPRTVVWSAQDTTALIASAAVAGVVVDPRLLSDLDQRMQDQRETIPLQVPVVFSAINEKLVAAAANIQARIGYQGTALHLRSGVHAQPCPVSNFSVMVAAAASTLAVMGMPYQAAVFAAIAAFERLCDAFSNCNTHLM